MRIFVVQGKHWHIPGRTMSAHTFKSGADAEAASLVNILRKDVGMAENATAYNWQRRLDAARNARARQIGCDADSLGVSDADVWVTELEVR
jgi:hypothetical protein